MPEIQEGDTISKQSGRDTGESSSWWYYKREMFQDDWRKEFKKWPDQHWHNNGQGMLICIVLIYFFCFKVSFILS